jgi:cobalt/nickel transport system permease protein
VSGYNSNPQRFPSIYALIDIRLKIIFTLLYLIAVISSRNILRGELICYVAILLTWGTIARPPLKKVMQRLLLLIPFYILILSASLFSTEGNSLVTFKLMVIELSITDYSINNFIQMLMKSSLSIIALIIFSLSENRSELFRGLSSLNFPKILLSILFITIRYIDIIGSQLRQMLRARSARSYNVSFRKKFRSTGEILGSLFLRSITRSERLYMSMLARGFDGSSFSIHIPIQQNKVTILKRIEVCFFGTLLFSLLVVAKTIKYYYGN